MLLCVMRSGKAEEKERSEETSVTVRFWQLLYTCFFVFFVSLSVGLSPLLSIPALMASAPSAFTHLPLCFGPSISLCKQAEGQQLCPQAVSRHLVAMVYGALFAGLYVGLPWQGLFAILNVWQHCTDADDKHPSSHFDQ